MSKKNKKKYSKFKSFESRLNSFIDAYATENLRYVFVFFIFLLFATVNLDNEIARVSVGVLFCVLLSSSLLTRYIRKNTKIKTEVKSPIWSMVGKEFDIEISVLIEKGFLGFWTLKVINPRDKTEVEKEKQWKFWFFNPNSKKELKRWLLKNPQVYLNRENEPVVFKDSEIQIIKKNKEINIKMTGFVKKRGIQKISSIFAGKKDPLYLTQAIVKTELSQEKFLYCIPAPRSIPDWPSKKARQSFNLKNRNSEKMKKRIKDPNGDEFLGLREARKEDPLKNTHWKTLAKTGKRFVMEREEVLPIKMSLLIDPVLSDSPYAEERFEQMLEMVVGQAINTTSKKDIDWLLLDRQPISIDNKKHWDEMYKKIALFEPLSIEEANEEWNSLVSYWKRVAAVRVITTRTESDLSEWISYWKKIGIYTEIIQVPYINEGGYEK